MLAQPRQRRCGHRQAGGGRRRSHPQDQAGIAFRAGIAGEDDFAGELDDALVERAAHRPSQGGEPPARECVRSCAQPGVDVEADRAGGVGKHARQVESVADAQRRADFVGVLGQHEFTAAAGDPVQFGADVQQGQVRLAEGFGRRGQRPARIDVGQLGDRQRVEQLHIAQPTAAGLEVGLGAMCDLAAALPACFGVFDEFVEARSDSGAPLPTRTTDQQRRQIGVARDVAHLEHRQAGRDVLTGDLERLGNGSHAVVEPNVGVPQRVPQLFGDVADHVLALIVVQQHQVEVGVRQQFPPAEAAGGDDGEATGLGDSDLGGLGREPELVQVEQGVAQRRRIQVMGAGQQLFDGSGQVGRRF